VRIQLKEGKQKELIDKAKSGLTWKEMSEELGLAMNYIVSELRYEKRLLSKEAYERLCALTSQDYEEFIVERLDDNWGRSKGGRKSIGHPQIIKKSIKDEKLAELIGIILGDGHVERRAIGKKIRCYTVKIAGHIEQDRVYLSNHVSEIIKDIYEKRPTITKNSNYGVMWATVHGRGIIEDLMEKGLLTGNKKKNNQGIPEWIKENKAFLAKCLRGLIDTDGSIHHISKENRNLRICFTSYIPKLMKDVREGFIALGYNPSKVIKENQFFITRKENVARYIKEIGFANEKHLKRLESLAP
jgi:hypothetical protein